MNYYFSKDLVKPALLAGVVISILASGAMGGGLFLMQRLFPVHVLALIVIGALVYVSVYALTLTVWNRISLLISP
jgi:hypothetical protein